MLRQGVEILDIDLSDRQQSTLLDYVSLLARWNTKHNLTAVRDEAAMVTRHLLDSLTVFPYLRGQRFIDVGTGAGLPGIPLAVAAPDRHFVLLDTNGKKTRFLLHAVASLGLSNVEVVKARVEEYVPEAGFDAVISRAFASLDDMMTSCQHLLLRDGEFLAMKGQQPVEELQQIESRVSLINIPLHVPGLSEERCLLRLRPNLA
jgi:16S rRNA (guanine527-N7)-methyltransferase